jgi:hypothetical protein
MKKVLLVLLVLAAVVGGAVWYFTTYKMDAMIEQQVEKAGAASFGTPVSVGKVETNIKDGSLRISDITVANPSGFNNKNAFTLSGIEAAVDYSTWDIKRVFIEKPQIVIEEKDGSTNFNVMLDRLNQGEKVPVETTPEGVEEPVITIHHFRMNESTAAFESKSMDRYSDLSIDEVEMTNLTGTPSELATIIATEVLNEVTKEAATEMLKAQARKKYDDVEQSVSDKFKDMMGGDEDSGN